MAANEPRPGWLRFVRNHNPFYVVSTGLMLWGVRAAYGEQEIGAIFTPLMVGVLAAYTLLLAAIGTAIVRWGRVWEDARSVFVALLILFFAVATTADDLFVQWGDDVRVHRLLAFGLLFSAATTEFVLRGAGIRFPWGWRLPLHLLLGLIYVWPWLCSPERAAGRSAVLEAAACAFPTVAAGVFLLLWPAIRSAPRRFAETGTPWSWPWVGGVPFVVLFGLVGLRAFQLAMTFGQTGAIWIEASRRTSAISFDVIFDLWFLVPLACVGLVLLLEAALVLGRPGVQAGVVCVAPGLLLLGLPWSDGPVARAFLAKFVATCGSPLWIALLLLLAFFGWAALRGVKGAKSAWLTTVPLLSFVGPATIGTATRVAHPEAWPWVIAGCAALVVGISRRSSAKCLLGVACAAAATWFGLHDVVSAPWREAAAWHGALAGLLAVGLLVRDRLTVLVQRAGAMALVATLVVLPGRAAFHSVPAEWVLGHLAALGIAALVLSRWMLPTAYLLACGTAAGLLLWSGGTWSYRSLVRLFGREALAAMTWSLAALGVAVLISAIKAQWMPAWPQDGGPPDDGDSPPPTPPDPTAPASPFAPGAETDPPVGLA